MIQRRERYPTHLDWKNFVKMAILIKAFYRFNAIPMKISLDIFLFFTELEKNNLKIYMESQKSQNCQSNSKEKEQKFKHSLPEFRLYYKAIVIKTARYWHKKRHIDQRKRIEK